MTSQDTLCPDASYIIETVLRLDKLQKEAVMDSNNGCISCNSSLLTAAYNTIPVAFTSCCQQRVTGISSFDSSTAVTTEFFRIESVRQSRYATLRLLVLNNDGILTATNNTMILDLAQVTSMQCFSPISVVLCNEVS